MEITPPLGISPRKTRTFASYYDIEPAPPESGLDTPCALWNGAKTQKGWRGYAIYTDDAGTFLLHRRLYVEQVTDPGPRQLDHLCRRRNCINVRHLEPVTVRQNVVERGTGLTARNAAKSGCGKTDHPVEFDYVWTGKNGLTHRSCSACRAVTRRAYRQRERDAGRVPK